MNWITKYCVGLIAIVTLAFGTVFLTGCESQSDPYNVEQYFDEEPYDTADREEEGWPALIISPEEVELSASELSARFQAAGGRPPYTWTVSDISLGTISAGSADAVYQRNGATAGVNIVILSDVNGRTTVATVTQL